MGGKSSKRDVGRQEQADEVDVFFEIFLARTIGIYFY
jgi:hypothetical protein